MKAYRLIIFYLVSIAAISACKELKDQPKPEIKFTPTQGPVNTTVKISGKGFGKNPQQVTVRFNNVTAVIKELTDSTIITAVPANAVTGKVNVQVNNTTITSTTDFIVISEPEPPVIPQSVLTGTWVQKADFPGKKRGGMSAFSGAGSGFITLGANGDFTEKDTWQYQPATDQWVQRPNFPGRQRFDATTFSIGKKAYVVTGFAYFSSGKINDFWEFDTETFVWTKKADFPGTVRQLAVAFAIQNKGYVTTGYTDYFAPELRDMWEYDPAKDKWQQKANIPFPARMGAAGFSIGDKGYVGYGSQIKNASTEPLKDFWEYNPATDQWTRKADVPKSFNYVATSFVLQQNGYIINENNACWQYSPATNIWVEKTSVPETANWPVSFVVEDKAYLVMQNTRKMYVFEP